MGEKVYERPRERLRSIGVASLSRIELLQLIIGSGNSRVSGAKLARMVDELLANGVVSYETLVSLPGLGEAKACQLLASFEIGARVSEP